MNEIDLHISTHPSEFLGYQAKSGTRGTITLFASSLWKEGRGEFDRFVAELEYVYLLERICIERAFQRIRMKDRCEPFCKLQKVADLMRYPDEWPDIREFWSGRRAEERAGGMG